MDADKRQEIALFRYQVIAPLVTQSLNRPQYGLLLWVVPILHLSLLRPY